jgi:hypothetical protein
MKRSPRPRKTATLPESIQRQLNMYTLAATATGVGILALAVPTEAVIVYTPATTEFLRVAVTSSISTMTASRISHW